MATIIRKDSPDYTRSGRTAEPVAFSLSDIRSQADDYLQSVRQEAAKIVQQAHKEAEQIRRQADAAGRKAAEAAIERVLEERVAKRMQSLIPALEQLIREINDAKGHLLNQWEQSAMAVATRIAERIIRRELQQQPAVALGLIGEALRLAAGSGEITLHINPTDHENLGPQIEQLSSTLARLAPSQIVTDSEVTLGGCRVETRFGAVDMQIESQLRRIEEELN
jgi:flagellar assembly protein FliH